MDKILELELTSNDPAEISQLLDQYRGIDLSKHIKL
jgi:hypothetical protein